jgi:cobalt/nickel transport system ATP-binding protein
MRESVVEQTAPHIGLHQLRFQYGDGTLALQGISLTVNAGESVALVGPNGSGKSTLLMHLVGLLQGQGEIVVAGLPVVKTHLPEIRRRVGLVFQHPDDQLFLLRLYDDVAFGPRNQGLAPDDVHARVTEALARVRLDGYVDRVAHHLSTGEKKRAALATVLAMQPEILLLDEPSSNLDPRSRRDLQRILAELPVTKIIATHDMEFALALCNRAVILDAGQVVADGPCRALFADADLMERHGLEVPASLCAPACC